MAKTLSSLGPPGDMWTRECTNQTGTELCSCTHSPLTGSIPYQDPAGWSYAGVAIVDGEVYTQWHVTPGIFSHWRDWHSADALSPSLLKRLLNVEGGAAE